MLFAAAAAIVAQQILSNRYQLKMVERACAVAAERKWLTLGCSIALARAEILLALKFGSESEVVISAARLLLAQNRKLAKSQLQLLEIVSFFFSLSANVATAVVIVSSTFLQSERKAPVKCRAIVTQLSARKFLSLSLESRDLVPLVWSSSGFDFISLVSAELDFENSKTQKTDSQRSSSSRGESLFQFARYHHSISS